MIRGRHQFVRDRPGDDGLPYMLGQRRHVRLEESGVGTGGQFLRAVSPVKIRIR